MFEKLDAYDLLANLVPGAALTYALHYSDFPSPSPDDLGAFLLVAFVAGVTTNRLGSIVLDPFFRRVGFLNEKDYDAFVTAEKADEKLSTLVENHGLYRTFFTAGFVYLILLSLKHVFPDFDVSSRASFIVLVIAGMIVFACALRKEDKYIHTRVAKARNSQRGK